MPVGPEVLKIQMFYSGRKTCQLTPLILLQKPLPPGCFCCALTSPSYPDSDRHPFFKTLYESVMLLLFSCQVMSNSLATQWTIGRQAPPSMGFPRQEHWRGLPFPSPADLPNASLTCVSLALQADCLPLSHRGSPSLGVLEEFRNHCCFFCPCPLLSFSSVLVCVMV